MSPAAWLARRCSNARIGFFADSASVIRRCGEPADGVLDGTAGASPGHHATTGASGSSSGMTMPAPASSAASGP